MGKKILITRANHQAQAFATVAVNRLNGVSMNDFIFEPMTDIVHFPINTAEFEEYGGIIMTSMNAAVSLGLNAPARALLADKPFYCVGEHTKQKILSLGAQNVAICTPTATQLAKEMLKGDKVSLNEGKKLLYMRGRDVTLDMKVALSEDDKNEKYCNRVDQIVCYEARAVERFSPNIAEALAPKDVGLITFFSKRTAEVFVKLWNQALEKDCEYKDAMDGVKALCISQDVAACVHELFGKSACIVSDKPEMSSMIDKIDEGIF
jgi:uroporphyrinogen-III synthase